MTQCDVYINGVLATDERLSVRFIRASYVRPWEAELYYAGRHDAPTGVRLWDDVRIEQGGTTRFRGNVTAIRPGGVAQEGVTIVCHGRRFRLENEPVRINGRGFYVWNRRGHLCDEGQGGEDSPGGDGGKWTAGEIVIDILEHALGVPAGGSDIPGHHGDSSCATDTYLTSADIAGYTAADWLALDSVVGEFSVDDTPVAQAISLLLALNGGFYGWYIDPATGNLELADLDALPTTDIEAGELGQWQDAAGTDYRLLGNELEWSLDGVCSTIVIQANIEGSGNPGKGDLGEMELVAAPWKDFAAAYRPLAQPKRHFTTRTIDQAGAYTPPQGYWTYSHKPRLYVGTDAGAKYVYEPSSHIYPVWLVPSGIIGFHEVPSLGPGEKLWGWYWAEVPFTVQAGPDGDAYHCYGYERTRTVYDPAFKHTTSWPQPGTADDETAMGILAERLLRLYKDVRRQGVLRVDQVDFDSYHLGRRYNVVNLGPEALGGATSTTTAPPCTLMPTCWDTLAINAVEVTWDLERDETDLRVANTFFMLEDYSELKRRLEMNLFARRELHLSEDIYDCQVQQPSAQDDQDANQPTTTSTTPAPTTTTTPAECTENAVGTTDETEAAQTDSWNINLGCVKVTRLWRMAYDHTGDQKLYAYYRDETYDADGRLVAVSAETRVEIDAPEACT